MVEGGACGGERGLLWRERLVVEGGVCGEVCIKIESPKIEGVCGGMRKECARGDNCCLNIGSICEVCVTVIKHHLTHILILKDT